MMERTVTISGHSKILNMFGWRVGWATADERLIERMATIHQHTTARAVSFAVPCHKPSGAYFAFPNVKR